jgi:chromosome segregation ATPase
MSGLRKFYKNASTPPGNDEAKQELQAIEAEIKDCEDVMNGFMRPLKDLREKIAACQTSINHESKNFDGDVSKLKKDLSALQAQDKPLETLCKDKIKKSGFLDKFVSLNEQKMRLLSPAESSQYKPPQKR